MKVISGGQTGVDQGALSAALDTGTACGGWCPEGRESEDGPIPAMYPVAVMASADYRKRTHQNVLDADGTAILYNEVLEGGTLLTREFCEEYDQPYVLIDASSQGHGAAVDALVKFVTRKKLRVLNVAGPRASEWPAAFYTAKGVLIAALERLGKR